MSGNHYYAAQTVGGCESDTRLDVTVTIADPSAPTGNASQDFCSNESPLVDDISLTGSNLIFYNDQGEIVDQTTILTDGTIYTVTQVVNGCESDQSFIVTVHLDSIQLFIDTIINTRCNRNDGIAVVEANYGEEPYSYVFSNGVTDDTATELGVGSYEVIVTDANGCMDTIQFSMECTINLVPEFISLGGGGNDVWIIDAEETAEIQIYNRWGNLVFKASPYNNDFDGHSNVGGTLGTDYLPSGTYYYIIDHKNGETPESGYIEIVH